MTPENDLVQSRPGSPLSGIVAVVPSFNVGTVVIGVATELLHTGCSVIVVDDGSTDGGAAGLRALDVDLITFPRNRGKGHAILAGLQKALGRADARAIAILDADGQHDPAELGHLVAAFEREKADMLVGVRDFSQSDVPLRSRFGNVLTKHLLQWLLGVDLTDTQSGYRVLSRRFAEAVVREVPGGRYETEMAIVGLAIRGRYRIASDAIKTIYEPGNRSSHFRKVGDSMRIYHALFRAALARRKA